MTTVVNLIYWFGWSKQANQLLVLRFSSSPARTEKPQWVSCRQPGQVLTALSWTTSLIRGVGGSTWHCPLCECVSGCLFHLVLKCFHTEKQGLKWKMFGMYRFKRRPMTFFKRLLVIFLRNVMNYIIFKFHYLIINVAFTLSDHKC